MCEGEGGVKERCGRSEGEKWNVQHKHGQAAQAQAAQAQAAQAQTAQAQAAQAV